MQKQPKQGASSVSAPVSQRPSKSSDTRPYVSKLVRGARGIAYGAQQFYADWERAMPRQNSHD